MHFASAAFICPYFHFSVSDIFSSMSPFSTSLFRTRSLLQRVFGLRMLASIQPRTSPRKSAKIEDTVGIECIGRLHRSATTREASSPTPSAGPRTRSCSSTRWRLGRARWKWNGKLNVRVNKNWIYFKTKIKCAQSLNFHQFATI